MLNLTVQGYFYLVTGLWPIIHMRSFEWVSGEKTDKWLVYSLGLMIASSGLMFVVFSERTELLYLAILNALSLAVIDVIYVARRVIRKVYLADAFVELGFVCWNGWVLIK